MAIERTASRSLTKGKKKLIDEREKLTKNKKVMGD